MGGGIDWKKLLAIVAAVAVGVFAWHTKAVYPLKLLVVLIHESGHALAAKLVGGTVESITIDTLEGGLCSFRYQPTFLHEVVTASAGYLGSALSGALLLIATLRYQRGRWVLGLLSAGLLVVCLLWARSPFTIAVALGMSALLGLATRFFPPELAQLTALFIGVFNSLYALFDLKDDLWSAERRAGTDAALLAKATHIPSIVWAVLWTLIAVGMLAFALWFSARGSKPRGSLSGPAPRQKPRPA
ncbi:MAG: M50 family metallopeptidase [Deltaproteobacteria bacterium]|nr:M50 family metallopeptidase [Deltaproteobacteria bacterium]